MTAEAPTHPDDPEWPPYAYVPGGPWPHPAKPGGHSTVRQSAPPPVDPDAWIDSAEYLEGFRLFNAGYYWEAHEVWESLWHVHGRNGPVADLLRALVKLAAAGVKVREGQPHGVRTHALRAAELFGRLPDGVGPTWLGLDLAECGRLANQVADSAINAVPTRTARVLKVFPYDLNPR